MVSYVCSCEVLLRDSKDVQEKTLTRICKELACSKFILRFKFCCCSSCTSLISIQYFGLQMKMMIPVPVEQGLSNL